jgi:hypothetical protein
MCLIGFSFAFHWKFVCCIGVPVFFVENMCVAFGFLLFFCWNELFRLGFLISFSCVRLLVVLLCAPVRLNLMLCIYFQLSERYCKCGWAILQTEHFPHARHQKSYPSAEHCTANTRWQAFHVLLLMRLVAGVWEMFSL